MSSPTAESPPARRLARPRWLDARLLAGIVLVVVSVAAGAKLLGDAEEGDTVWVASRDLAAGSTLQSDDVEPATVQMAGSVSSYVDASGPAPAGYLVVRDVAAGELLPAAALSAGSSAGAARRFVSVPVAPHHFPSGLARGDRVDVYVVPASTPADLAAPEPDLVLAGAVVSQAGEDSGAGLGASASSVGFVLEVGESDVPALVAAIGSGSIQLVGVPAATSDALSAP
jgi:Flp pilus assembly protein CpaB